MLSVFECSYCASCKNKLISSFHSAVLDAKTTVYQCEKCLNLFDFSRNVEKQELQQRLSDLWEDAEERISVTTASELSLDPGDESLVRVVIYGYDNLNNRVPVDSYWISPSGVRSFNLEHEMPTDLDTVDGSIPHLLKLFLPCFR
jgi:hypothetical protein